MSLPTALTYQYTDATEVNALLSAEGVALRLDDDGAGAVGSTELAILTTNVVNYATSRCNLFLAERYAPADLAQSWQVHNWATIVGAVYLCRRRGNTVPTSLRKDYKEAIEEMQSVHDGLLALSDIAERNSEQATLSNMRLDSRYRVKQLRVERPISTRTGSVMPQTVDYPADYIAAYEDFPR